MDKQYLQEILYQNAVLFYSDVLSLKEQYIPVTDTCKYYVIFGVPVHVSYLLGNIPEYNMDNKYYLQSIRSINNITDKFGYDGIQSFIYNLCSVGSMGCINGEQILKCVLYYEDRKVIKKALDTYKNHTKCLKYFQSIKNEDGNDTIEECSKYVFHANRIKNKSKENDKKEENKKISGLS